VDATDAVAFLNLVDPLPVLEHGVIKPFAPGGTF
jgi:hypothetical protein